jgi:outer membrane immunogenic protein
MPSRAVKERQMKNLLLAAVIAAVTSVSANAADMAYKSAPMAQAAYSWTGLYIGGQVGGASLSSSFKDNDDSFDNQGLNPDRKYTFTGGVYGGYNWQINSMVVGIDAQWSWYGDSSVASFPRGTEGTNSNFFLRTKLHDAGSVKARVGLAFQDTLVYVAAGPAWANSTFDVGYRVGGLATVTSESTYRSGIAVATGVEHMFGPNWVGRGQIQYSDFGAQHLEARTIGGFGQQTSIVEATVGLAYKF